MGKTKDKTEKAQNRRNWKCLREACIRKIANVKLKEEEKKSFQK